MKKSKYLFVLGMLCNAGLLLSACSPQIVLPTATPAADTSGPAVGTLMAWVDGNTLTYFSCDESPAAPEYMWVYQSEVTNYQLSLCMQAGSCQPPAGESPWPDISDPALANSPAQIIGPDVQEAYCHWAQGKLLPNDDAAQMAKKTDANGNPLYPSTEHGFRCAVDSPHPMGAACQTGAFYLNGAPAPMDHSVTQAGQFCQNGVGYVTLDVAMPDGGKLQSVNGDCQVVGDNRLLCNGAPGSSGGGEALITCNGMLPYVQDNGLPATGSLQCLTGYDVNGDTPALCGIISPGHGSPSQPAGGTSVVVFKVDRGAAGGDSPDCGPFLHFDETSGRCSLNIDTSLLAQAGSHSRCDFGFTFNAETGRCIPDMSGWTPPHGTTDCGIGYRFDEAAGICMPDLSGLPPASPCLGGMTFNETTGMCEPSLSGWRPPGGQTSCGPGLRFDDATGTCIPNISGVPSSPRCLGNMTFNEATGMCEPNISGWHLPSGQTTCGSWFRFDEATGTCIPNVSGVPSPPTCLAGTILNKATGMCEPSLFGCPIGTYFDLETRTCIAPQAPSSDCLEGYHLDSASQCCQADLPSGLYPGCPPGQAYDPSTGACDAENIWQAGGKVLHTVEFDFSAPSCESSGGGKGGCKSHGDKLSCSTAGCTWDSIKNTCN